MRMPRSKKEQRPIVHEVEHPPSKEGEQPLPVDEAQAERLAMEALLQEESKPAIAPEVHVEKEKPMGRSSFELLAHAGPMYETLFKEESFLFQSKEQYQESFLVQEARKLEKEVNDLTPSEVLTILARAPAYPFSSDALNAYMERQAHTRWSKGVRALSEKQFGMILDDQESFKDWAADQVVELFLQQRKKELADWRKKEEGSYGKFGETMRTHPTYERMREKEKEVNWSVGRKRGKEQQGLMGELHRVTKEAETKISDDAVVQALEATIARLEEQQKEGKVSVKDIVAFKKQLEDKKQELRQTLGLETQQQDLQKRIEAATERRKKEFEELDRLMKQEVEGGFKREMALVTQRWGNVLARLVKDGRVSMDAGRTGITETWGDPRKYVSDFLDVELDRVIAAKRQRRYQSSADIARRTERTLNLEAIIRSEDELKVAREYLNGVVDRLEGAYRGRNWSESRELEERFFAMMDFLQTRGDDYTGKMAFNRRMILLEHRVRKLKGKPEDFEEAAKGHEIASDRFLSRVSSRRVLAEAFLQGFFRGISDENVSLTDSLTSCLADSTKRSRLFRACLDTIRFCDPKGSGPSLYILEKGFVCFINNTVCTTEPQLDEEGQQYLRQDIYRFIADLGTQSIISLHQMKRDFRQNPDDDLVTLLRKWVPSEERKALATELGKQAILAAGSFRNPEDGLRYAVRAMEQIRRIKAPEVKEAVAAK